MNTPSDTAFSPSVKAVQARKGSRNAYARQEAAGGWADHITPDLKAFVEAQTSVFLATASASGQPYIQHRGGPAGFLRVLDERTIAFVDYAGNRQYISQGNLAENDQAYLFLIDYAHRRRIKIWGRARPEQVILFDVATWDANCPQHIPQRFEAADVAAALRAKEDRIAELEAEVAALKARV